MQLRNVLGKATELGIGIVATTTLILAGCGGGGAGSSSTATCSATGNVSGARAVNCFFAETATDWNADLIAGISNWAGTSSAVARASSTSFVATGANTYTYNSSQLDLATSSSVWSTATSTSPSFYILAATGWQSYSPTSATYTNNGDGTITFSIAPWYQANVSSITRTDLTGQAVTCTNPLGSYVVGENIGSASSPVIVAAASCPVAATYPAGSASYTTTTNVTENETYFLWDYPTLTSLTDGSGNTLSVFPSIGTRFCLNRYVYDPITGPTAGADNYNVHYSATSAGCTSTSIADALASSAIATALVSLRSTGHAVVPNMFDIRTTTTSGTFDSIYAFHLGELMQGLYSPASTSTSTSTGVNKTAANAQLRAAGLPQLP